MTTRYFSTDEKGKLPSPEDEEKEKKTTEAPIKQKKEAEDPFPGPAPISEEKIKNYQRKKKNNTENVRDKKLKGRMAFQEKKYKTAVNQAARFELLLTEEAGFIEADKDEETFLIDQQEMRKHVDIASAQKQFELNLNQFGPYCISYTRNGRYMLLGGHRGHVAAFDWTTKKLMCEMNVMEMVNDVKWLHTENMFAVAQRKWVYVYDNQGIELHCLKDMNETLRLDYLPYHFLLVASSRTGFLHYLDISLGKKINSIFTRGGRLSVMTQNPYNAVVALGHHNGTVTMWSPMMRDPLVKMLCHKSAVRAVAVDKSGLYMATSGQDNKMKIFDIRTFKPVHAYQLTCGASNLKFSQRGLVAATCSNIVEIYHDPCRQLQEKPYLVHSLRHPACDIEFCPYEDVLGVGREDGFQSLLVPGAGEPNYDALESNPFQSKSQRKEWEVKALMEKIQPDMISLDPFNISSVDHVTAEQKTKDREQRMGFKKGEPKFEPRFKTKGRSSAGNVQKRKQSFRNQELREKIRKDARLKKQLLDDDCNTTSKDGNTDPSHIENTAAKKGALERFKKAR